MEIRQLLKHEWEIAALCGAALFGVVLLAAGIFCKPVAKWTFGHGAVSVERPVKLNKSAFAFLKEKPEDIEYERNPFASKLMVREIPKPVVKEAPKPVMAPIVEEKKEEPKPVVQEAVVEEKKEEAPKGPQKVIGMATYLYMNLNASGKTVAVFSLQTSKTETENYVLGVGESGGGVQVIAITDDALGVQDAAGRRWKITKGKPSRMVVLKPVDEEL